MPPIEVLRTLRREVGFVCPVRRCENPYLTWHHFDPPWHEDQHHNPEGMIALCRPHHDKADAGNFTKEQLRKLKATGQRRPIRASFDWRRQALLAVVGGNYYFEPKVVLRYRGKDCLFFTRDEEQNLLLNLEMPSGIHEPRLQIRENFWIVLGHPTDLYCPPSGKILEASYPNGDKFSMRFADIRTSDQAVRRYRTSPSLWLDVPFPLTTVEMTMNIEGTPIVFASRMTSFGGVRLSGGCFRGNDVAVDIEN